jgi:tetratricopeptide (TPR) repeat protein
MSLAERIRDLRVQAGLTKTALAKPRYTVSFVSQIEAGRRSPSPDALGFFADRLGVSPRYLSTGIPEHIEQEFRYRLEEARTSLRAGRSEEAEQLVRPMLDTALEYGLASLRNQGLALAAEALVQQGKVQAAVDLFEESLEGDLPPREEGLTVAGLAKAYRTVGDLTYAAQLVESFIARPKEAPLDPSVAAELQSVLVSIYFERGDVYRAERAARRALAIVANSSSLELKAKTYWYAGRVFAEARRWEEAAEFATRARILMEEMDDRRSVARLHNAYAFICIESEPPRLEEAREHLDKAQELLAESGAAGDLAYVLEERGRMALMEAHPEEALVFADQALASSSPDELETARCLYMKGRALAALGRGEEAGQVLSEAATAFRRHGARQQEASCWREMGELQLGAGNLAQAVQALQAGLEALDPRRTRA